MSAGPERVFSGTRHTLAFERIRLGAGMVEITECIKSWVRIPPGRASGVLSGVFRSTQHVEEAAKILEEAVEEEDGEEMVVMELS